MGLMGRRQFLIVSAASLSSYALFYNRLESSSARGRILVCYAIEPDPSRQDGSNKYGFLNLDLDSNVAQQADVPFNFHDIAVNPTDRSRGVGAIKFGRHYGEVSIDQTTFLTQFEIETQFNLLGHMAYSDDGNYLCATAVRYVESKNSGYYQNELLLMNPRTFKVEDSIRVPQFNPAQHDCRFLPDSHILATTAGNTIAYIDIKTRKIERAEVTGLFPNSAIRHFGMSRNGRLAIQANVMGNLDGAWTYNQGDIVVADRVQARAEALSMPVALRAAFDREILDLCFDRTGDIFAVTANGARKVSFWDFKTGESVAEVEVPRAVRVVLTKDGRHFVVLTRNGLRYISASTYQPEFELNQFDDFFKKNLPTGSYVSHCRLT